MKHIQACLVDVWKAKNVAEKSEKITLLYFYHTGFLRAYFE